MTKLNFAFHFNTYIFLFFQEEQPWNVKREYHPPVTPMDGCTTYKLSYWPNCEKPRKPFTLKESENLLNASCCFDDNTTYKLSFFGCGGDKPDPIKPSENVIFSRCPLSLDTTHRVTFYLNFCENPFLKCHFFKVRLFISKNIL